MKNSFHDTLKAVYAGEGLRRIWESLSELDRLAVAEAVYHDEHRFQGGMLAAKYGDRPPFYIEKEVKRGRYIDKEKIPTRLNLFFFRTKDFPGAFLPADVADRLRGFVPEPKRAELSVADEPPEEDGLAVRNTEPEALAEVMALLRLAEAGGCSRYEIEAHTQGDESPFRPAPQKHPRCNRPTALSRPNPFFHL